MISNTVRCVPPQNKPTPAEIATCRQFLIGRIAALPRLRSLLAIGRIAHDGILDAFALKRRDSPFAHGARHALPNGLVMFDSYHCSRQITDTGRLTTAMFEAVLAEPRPACAGRLKMALPACRARQVGHALRAFGRLARRGWALMAGFEISPDKVGFVIIKPARSRPKSPPGTTAPPRPRRRVDPQIVLRQRDPDELKDFIRDLNVDEQASLVALAWIGRGSFAPDELEEALSTARAEQTNRTEDYLLGMPLLPDYLEEGLDRLGYSVEDAEDESL